ncbi:MULTISPECIES: hypothetical protein [unclassified Bradyrhizobium]|uniref:hypothetical protein n=1 Tax=unclassified Bradyrhizobium TaxID=2631580 RepID=UPI002FF3A63B
MNPMRDLRLTYEQALHGIQSAIRFEMSRSGIPDDEHNPTSRMMKHLRVGIDMRAADHAAVAGLLIEKGIITEEEYLERMRLAANEELARYEEYVRDTYDINASFR